MTTTVTEHRGGASRRRVRLAAATITALATAGVLATAGSAAAQYPPPEGNSYPAKKTLSAYSFQTQSKYYYCGPAATRLALTQRGKTVSQKTLAKDLEVETHEQQTDNIGLVTKALNKRLKTSWYESKKINGNTASSAAVKRLKADIKYDIYRGHVIVANVYGTAYDTAGTKHTYNQGHYLTVVGYTKSGDRAIIEDIAYKSSSRHRYTMTTKKLATWIASKGYSA
ncbi:MULTISPECIES: C39 family peptidase [unclassified Streptomyces]|uniref:C39 family peptidase n=1 Tax=unclassified Streptomyces TaxID=2593676 RepID=UPI0036E25D75